MHVILVECPMVYIVEYQAAHEFKARRFDIDSKIYNSNKFIKNSRTACKRRDDTQNFSRHSFSYFFEIFFPVGLFIV